MIETSLGITEKRSFQSVTIFPVNIYYFIVKINEDGEDSSSYRININVCIIMNYIQQMS